MELILSNKYKKHFLKYEYVTLKEGMIEFLKEDSIVINEESLKGVESETKEEIQNVIDKFDYLFIKLNFSAPTDCNFMVTELKCFKLEDILTLLKSSEKMYDNIMLYENNKEIGLNLILREWYKIDTRNEYRCFIHNKELKAISQRHIDCFFDYDQEDLDEIKNLINGFINTLGIESELNTGIVDVIFLPKSKKFKIVDILTEEIKKQLPIYTNDENNYFLLYNNWEDILSNTNTTIRVVKSPEHIIDKDENLNKFPIEMVNNNVDIDKLIHILNKEEQI